MTSLRVLVGSPAKATSHGVAAQSSLPSSRTEAPGGSVVTASDATFGSGGLAATSASVTAGAATSMASELASGGDDVESW